MENLSEKSIEKTTRKRWGLAAVGITGVAAVGLSVVSAPFVTPALRKFCLPFVPATSRQVKNVLTMCRKDPSSARRKHNKLEKLIDLGSGDGRIVLEAARNGFHATGVELNFWLVLYSKVSARLNSLHRMTTFQRKNLWKFDLSDYDKIVIFGVEEMMPSLKEKIASEINNDCKVIACRFPLPKCKPVDSIDEGIDSVWLYSKNSFREI